MKIKFFFLLCFFACINNMRASNVSNYVEFARVYGIVRYFSPNPYTKDWSESDWLKVCALLANRVETQSMDSVFNPLSPSMSFSSVPVSLSKGAFPSEGYACYYNYSGSGKLNIPFLAKLLMPGLAKYIPYYKELVPVKKHSDSETVPVAGRYYSYKIADGKYLNIQHALPKELFDNKATNRLLSDAKSYWKNHKSEDKTISKRRRFIFGLLSDKAVRVADLIVRWNIIRHFYPYYEGDNLNWDNQLEVYLQETIQMGPVDSYESLFEWYDLICRFFNPIKDGHLFVRRDMKLSGIQSTYLPEYYAEIEYKLVNDTLLIHTPIDGKPVWRLVHTLNGEKMGERIQYCREITNAATEAHRNRMAADKLFSSPVFNTPFIIESSDLSGHRYQDTLYARRPDAIIPKRNYQSIQKFESGILYVDATSRELNEKYFLSALTPDIKGLCFDLRGLPSYKFEDILAHLISSDAAAPATEIPINCFPFQQGVSWRVSSEILKSKNPHIALPTVFICDASTVSWGETILMMVRHYNLGKIVGQTTAGTTGDMTLFDLPIFPFSMTGMRMHCMNGERHHAIGIVPDLIVPVYVNDYISNFDRTLHTAFEVMLSGKTSPNP